MVLRRSRRQWCAHNDGRLTRSKFRALSSGASSSSELVVSSLDESRCIATLRLNRPPVNSLSLEMLQAISLSIKQVEANSSVQSLILTSSNPKIFSAGLDITEMHQPNPTRVREFWNSFQQLYLDLYGSRLACIAAMEGHAPAAGCMLALCCDYRIMASTETIAIGLNETKLGIAAPPWLGQLMVDTVGNRQAEMSISLGLLYSPQEALRISLVDEIVPKEDVLDRAKQQAETWAAISPQARVVSKLLTRKKHLDHLLETRQQDSDNFCSFVMKDTTQRNLGMYLDSLKKKNK